MTEQAPTREWARTHPKAVLTVGEVENAMLQLVDDMEQQSMAIKELREDAIEKRHAAELTYAKTFITVAGAQPTKREKAKKEVHAKAKEADLADAVYEAAKRRFTIMDGARDTLRTIAANIRGQT